MTPLSDDPSRCWRARIIDKVPLPLLTHAYEIGLAVILAVMAIPVVLGRSAPASIHSQMPHWMVLGWGWGLLLASTFTLLGVFLYRPRMEWSGQLWMGYTLGIYAAALAWNTQDLASAAVAVAVFAALALIGFWRSFKISSAPYLQHRLAREARDAHIKAVVARRRHREV